MQCATQFAPFRRFDGTLLSYVRQSTRLRTNPSRTPKIHQILAVLRGVCIFIKNEILTQTGGNPYLFDRTFNIMRKNAVFRARIYYLYNKIG